MASPNAEQLSHIVFDVDGVFTTGQFLYTAQGKFAKIFGAHDADGIKAARPHFTLSAITADHRGFSITRSRIEQDMKIPLTLVPETERRQFFKSNYPLTNTAYMGDGYHDRAIFDIVAYGIAPANAILPTKQAADYITQARGGEGAVAEACWHLLELAKIEIADPVAAQHV